MLRLADLEAGSATASWTQIRPPAKTFKPRMNFAAVSIDSSEILIYGGQTAHGAFLNDIVLFDSRTKKCSV